MSRDSPVGTLVIGRNEGARLITCLNSIPKDVICFDFVASGSTEGSLAEAETLVVQMDMIQPLTAARNSNADFRKVIRRGSSKTNDPMTCSACASLPVFCREDGAESCKTLQCKILGNSLLT